MVVAGALHLYVRAARMPQTRARQPAGIDVGDRLIELSEMATVPEGGVARFGQLEAHHALGNDRVGRDIDRRQVFKLVGVRPPAG